MAELTVNHPHKLTTASGGSVSGFGVADAALVLRNVQDARSILRAVALAARAQSDGSIVFENNNTGRWHPAVDVACVRLQAVRNVLLETGHTLNLDWFTSLALVEALAAALWRGSAGFQGDKLEEVELESVALVAIESLDSLMQECEAEGLFEMTREATAATVH